MDLHWLTAPEREVEAAARQSRTGSRPSWVPSRRQVLVHINDCLILWYLCVVLMVFGIRIDTLQDNRIEARDVGEMVICAAVFAAWILFAVWLRRWSARPQTSRSRMRENRQRLTALANGFEPAPRRSVAFSSLITVDPRAPAFPRFVSDGFEFGNLGQRSRSRAGSWHYLVVQLPAPVPHLLLDSTAIAVVGRTLPVHLGARQELVLEGDFGRWFRASAPSGYGRDARFLLTPDVMAALVDHAHDFTVEAVGDRLVFFRPGAADLSDPGAWNRVESIRRHVAGPLARNASRYRDERIPEQSAAPSWARTAHQTPGEEQPELRPRIAADGARLRLVDRRTGVWWALGALGWGATLVLLYVVPGLFAFAGFMSIVDGR